MRLRPRLLTALVGLPVLLGVVWVGSPWLTIVVVAVAVVGWWEFHRMFAVDGEAVALVYGALWTGLLVVSGQLTSVWRDSNLPLLSYLVLGGGLIVALPWLARAGAGDHLAARVRLLSGPAYVGFLLAHALALRQLGDGSDAGRDWLLFALLATFAADSGAMIVGRLIGRHSVVPSISPGKTWEGAVGGFLSAVAVGVVVAATLELPLATAAGLSAAVGILAQVGDLAESRLKRTAGVKDAGAILPGHGGLLDRLDSVVFTTPAMYYVVALAVKP